jgi:hypothetical protein
MEGLGEAFRGDALLKALSSTDGEFSFELPYISTSTRSVSNQKTDEK